jgi:uncharacterized phage protein gp47/JayE
VPIFQPRNRVQILREMVGRVIARSKLVGLFRNSVVFHLLAAAANEDSEQYVQMARLRNLFSIDKASGSDLDERAKEIVPGIIRRRPALFATTTVIFSRPGVVGVVAIPVGTQVYTTDAQGQVRFRTTAAASILAGNTTSGAVPVVATAPGDRANVDAGQIVGFANRIPGVTGVTNPANVDNGQNRESDESFRARLKAFVQAISRGTRRAIEGFARSVILATGQRVLFAKVVETILPSGLVVLYIDDGTGNVETYDATYIAGWDTFLSPAVGGEQDIFTTELPIRDDGGFALEIDTGSGFVAQVRGTDYELNPALGQIELSSATWPTGLPAGAICRAHYRYYTGLIAEVQRVIDGDEADPIRVPGVRAAGIQVQVKAPQTVFQSITGAISVAEGFDPAAVADEVSSALQAYINGLDIGDDVIVAEIIQRAMDVTGMYNFRLIDLSGSSPPADQIVLSSQVARITAGSITLT